MSERTLTVSLGDRAYDIFFGSGIYPLFHEWICRFYPGGAVFVVTDRNVHSIYGDDIRKWLAGLPHEVLPLAPGEEAKTWEQVREVYAFLARGGATRDSLLVAFGGGVVGDLAGFAAATFLRGIPYLQVPTTLLAQVDSSVGGKTGFNLPEGKNLVGAFHQPRAVFIDHTFLRTLDRRNLRAGMAEVVKCALAGDAALFDILCAHGSEWGSMPERTFQTVIRRTVAFKAAVVERDEKEASTRRVLNLGHTIGHALEQASGYARHLHGEAVGMGLAWELAFSRRQGVTPAAFADRTIDLLAAMGFSLEDPDVPIASIAAAVGRDKKRVVSDIEMPLVTGPGTHVLRRIPVSLLRAELPAVRAEIRAVLRGRPERAAEGGAERPAPAGAGPETVDALEKRVVANPRDLSVLLALAEAYRRSGNRAGAWEMVKEALRQYPSDPRAQRAARGIEHEAGTAEPLDKAGKGPLPLEDVLILEEGSFELRPADAPELPAEEPAPGGQPLGPSPVRTVTMAEVYWAQGRREEARRIVEEILERDPADPRARAWRDARLPAQAAVGGTRPPAAGESAPASATEGARPAGGFDVEGMPVVRALRSLLKTIAKEYAYDIPRHH